MSSDKKLRAFGVTRMHDNDQAILVSFDRKPTDDELRDLHEALAGRAPLSAGVSITDEQRVLDAICKASGYESWFIARDLLMFQRQRPTEPGMLQAIPVHKIDFAPPSATERRCETIQECIAALDERVDSLVIMCDRAGYTREGSDLSQRVVATRDAIDILRRLNAATDSRAKDAT